MFSGRCGVRCARSPCLACVRGAHAAPMALDQGSTSSRAFFVSNGRLRERWWLLGKWEQEGDILRPSSSLRHCIIHWGFYAAKEPITAFEAICFSRRSLVFTRIHPESYTMIRAIVAVKQAGTWHERADATGRKKSGKNSLDSDNRIGVQSGKRRV